MNTPSTLPRFLTLLSSLAAALALNSCVSAGQMKKGDIIGGLINAPFEIAGGVIETATMPLDGKKPNWIKDAEVAAMKVDKPRMNDPRWTGKFSTELNAGSVQLNTFSDNLEAYKITKNDVYLSRAEQLATTTDERSQMELEVLRSLGDKAFTAKISINGSSTRPEYSKREQKVIFISSTLAGAKLHPHGNATLSLRQDLPFKIQGRYRVTAAFSFTVPREGTTVFMGMSQTNTSNSGSTVQETFSFGPGQTTGSCTLNFGAVNGATTVAALGGTTQNRVTGPPFTSFKIVSIDRL